jgi:hypothetical protein
MHDKSFQAWRQECDAIEQEMDRLIRTPVPPSAEERQVRRIQFAALVERREAAARKLIEGDRVRHHNKLGSDAPAPGDYLVSTAAAGSIAAGDAATFVSLPDGRNRADAQSARSPHDAAISAPAVPSDTIAPTADSAPVGPDPVQPVTAGPLPDQSAQPDAAIPARPEEDVDDLNSREQAGE